MISLEKKFLFIHVPKTGGNSIQDVLRDYSEDDIVILNDCQDGVERFEVRNKRYDVTKHSVLSQYQSIIDAETYRSLYKFATIRNPWDMMVSYYFSPHRGAQAWDKGDFIDLVHDTPTLRNFICENPHTRNILEKLGIRTPDRRLDADVDFVIRFEQLEGDFRFVCHNLGIPPPSLPRRNVSSRGHYSRYYDAELVEIVRNRFHEEITYGGYSFECA